MGPLDGPVRAPICRNRNICCRKRIVIPIFVLAGLCTDTAGGMDWQAKRLEGKIFTVRFIDSAGQIHLIETGLALIPGVDEYEIVK